MSILSRYLLKLHLVPFLFALSALTGVMLVNQVAKRLKDLVGKGLPWHVIAEVFALSLPFILAMTIPMAVLVSVLYTMSRLTVDSEITALRASGVSLARLVRPLFIASVFVSIGTFLFSDQVLPLSNHRLRALLTDISRKKPTFALEEQIINEVQRSRLFLRAGIVESNSYRLRDVTIFDISDHNRKRVTYADSAHMAFGDNEEDLYLTLFDGTMHESDRIEAKNFQIANFQQDRIRIEGVGSEFRRTLENDFKGDREMSVCEMDSVIGAARQNIVTSLHDAQGVELNSLRGLIGLAPVPQDSAPVIGRTRLYCSALQAMIPEDDAEMISMDTSATTEDSLTVSSTGSPPTVAQFEAAAVPRISTARVLYDRADNARRTVAQYSVELHKKYAIAAACIVFVLVGVPAAIKFPRGGVGLVVGMSLVVFTVYYVGLIAGETVANNRIVSPIWAMWTPNIIFAIVGMWALWAIRREATASRGADRISLMQRLRLRPTVRH